MDHETLTAILTALGLIAGGGATYGVQKLRNGTQPPPEPAHSEDKCLERHGDLQDSIHNLTTEVRTGFETINGTIASVSRADRDAHEERYHPVKT
jgi:hypothetical protein